ncbi:general transcription factor 3C polypeptide 6 isoform X2 [Channa argus]|uniref:general transcription factor 3C polypeptide 6 isoform X2 n=1 Tax=Channa argus TaxID=215402 RepID=UPI0035209FA1
MRRGSSGVQGEVQSASTCFTFIQEQLVVVELAGVINNDLVSKCRGTCKILDIDSEKPMMQIGQYVFAGEYEDALGTCVLFEEDPHRASGSELKYMCHTVKKLMMQRIFLTEKKDGETITGSGDGAEQDTTCHSSESENANQRGEGEEKIDNTNVIDSAVG